MLNALQINFKNYTLSTFPSSNWQSFEDSGKVLAVSVSEIYQSIAVQLCQPAYKMVITSEYVQIDNNSLMPLITCTKFQINPIILPLFSGMWGKNPTLVAEKVVKCRRQ